MSPTLRADTRWLGPRVHHIRSAGTYVLVMDDDIYMAGLIDGEGTIMMTRGRRGAYRFPTVQMTNTSPALIAFLRDTYGGVVRNQKRYKEHHRQAWVWSVRYNAALDCLQRVNKYLRHEGKRQRAALLLAEYKLVTVRNGQYTEAQLKAKLDFEARFMALAP